MQPFRIYFAALTTVAEMTSQIDTLKFFISSSLNIVFYLKWQVLYILSMFLTAEGHFTNK